MTKKNYLALGIIAASFVAGLVVYQNAPERMASHWGLSGEANGYLPKFWGSFLMPIVALILFFIFWFIPKIDPLRSNIEKFKGHFDRFVTIIIAFLAYIYLLTVLWNFGYRMDMQQFIMPAIAIIFYYAGVLIENAKPNWFVGIRTPWTLSSESVWHKTHELGGNLFKLVAVLTLLGTAIPAYGFFLMIIPVLLVVTYLFIYSYLEYRKEKRVEK
jgi:uncharacterized membrane protein